MLQRLAQDDIVECIIRIIQDFFVDVSLHLIANPAVHPSGETQRLLRQTRGFEHPETDFHARRIEGRIPDYSEIRERLVVDYNTMRRDRANEALYEGLSARYEIAIDEDAVRRVALDRS